MTIPKLNELHLSIAKQQREKAYAQDWDELTDHIRSIIKSNNIPNLIEG